MGEGKRTAGGIGDAAAAATEAMEKQQGEEGQGMQYQDYLENSKANLGSIKISRFIRRRSGRSRSIAPRAAAAAAAAAWEPFLRQGMEGWRQHRCGDTAAGIDVALTGSRWDYKAQRTFKVWQLQEGC